MRSPFRDGLFHIRSSFMSMAGGYADVLLGEKTFQRVSYLYRNMPSLVKLHDMLENHFHSYGSGLYSAAKFNDMEMEDEIASFVRMTDDEPDV